MADHSPTPTPGTAPDVSWYVLTGTVAQGAGQIKDHAMTKFSDSEVIESWKKNVQPWIRAVRRHEIESRKLITDAAIVEAVLGVAPKKVIDVGCGEGWLARELVDRGIDVLGIDAIPAFIESARNEGKGRFRALSYEALSSQAVGETFDAIVCNFSLFGNESVAMLFRAAPQMLRGQGSLIVQTLHPENNQSGESGSEGWREGSWTGFSSDFRDPAPWYFRTIESWKRLFSESGFASLNITEPTYPKTGIPASIIFSGRPRG